MADRLVVDEAVNDENSVATLHPKTMEKLQVFRGDNVLLKVRGSKQRLVPGGCSRQASMQPLRSPCSFGWGVWPPMPSPTVMRVEGHGFRVVSGVWNGSSHASVHQLRRASNHPS